MMISGGGSKQLSDSIQGSSGWGKQVVRMVKVAWYREVVVGGFSSNPGSPVPSYLRCANARMGLVGDEKAE